MSGLGAPGDPVCPPGFVVPNHPGQRGIKWIGDTNCAQPCLNHEFTLAEWETTRIFSVCLAVVGIIMIVSVIVLWLTDKERRKQYLVICFAFISLALSLVIVVSNSLPFDTIYCPNNAVPAGSIHDISACGAIGLLMCYVIFCELMAWLVISIDLFFKVVMNKVTKKYRWAYFGFIFGIPLFPSLYGLRQGIYGFNGLMPWCGFQYVAPRNSTYSSDISIFFVPASCMVGIGMVSMTAVIYKIFRIQNRAPPTPNLTRKPTWTNTDTGSTMGSIAGSNMRSMSTRFQLARKSSFMIAHRGSVIIEDHVEKFRAFRTPVVFLLVCMLTWLTVLVSRCLFEASMSVYDAELNRWTKCMFANLPSHTFGLCGPPPDRLERSLFNWIVTCVSGQSIFVSLIYLPNVRLGLVSAARRFLRPYIMSVVQIFNRDKSLQKRVKKFLMSSKDGGLMRLESVEDDEDSDSDDNDDEDGSSGSSCSHYKAPISLAGIPMKALKAQQQSRLQVQVKGLGANTTNKGLKQSSGNGKLLKNPNFRVGKASMDRVGRVPNCAQERMSDCSEADDEEDEEDDRRYTKNSDDEADKDKVGDADTSEYGLSQHDLSGNIFSGVVASASDAGHFTARMDDVINKACVVSTEEIGTPSEMLVDNVKLLKSYSGKLRNAVVLEPITARAAVLQSHGQPYTPSFQLKGKVAQNDTASYGGLKSPLSAGESVSQSLGRFSSQDGNDVHSSVATAGEFNSYDRHRRQPRHFHFNHCSTSASAPDGTGDIVDDRVSVAADRIASGGGDVGHPSVPSTPLLRFALTPTNSSNFNKIVSTSSGSIHSNHSGDSKPGIKSGKTARARPSAVQVDAELVVPSKHFHTMGQSPSIIPTYTTSVSTPTPHHTQRSQKRFFFQSMNLNSSRHHATVVSDVGSGFHHPEKSLGDGKMNAGHGSVQVQLDAFPLSRTNSARNCASRSQRVPLCEQLNLADMEATDVAFKKSGEPDEPPTQLSRMKGLSVSRKASGKWPALSRMGTGLKQISDDVVQFTARSYKHVNSDGDRETWSDEKVINAVESAFGLPLTSRRDRPDHQILVGENDVSDGSNVNSNKSFGTASSKTNVNAKASVRMNTVAVNEDFCHLEDIMETGRVGTSGINSSRASQKSSKPTVIATNSSSIGAGSYHYGNQSNVTIAPPQSPAHLQPQPQPPNSVVNSLNSSVHAARTTKPTLATSRRSGKTRHFWPSLERIHSDGRVEPSSLAVTGDCAVYVVGAEADRDNMEDVTVAVAVS
jgi:hypothetical protein